MLKTQYFQRLIFLIHAKMKRQFYAKQQRQYIQDMMELEDHDIDYNAEYYKQNLR